MRQSPSLTDLSKFYLKRFGFRTSQIKTKCDPETNLIIVIPCFNEPEIEKILNSLSFCSNTQNHIEVIVVVNASENDSIEINQQNEISIKKIKNFSSNNHISFHFLNEQSLPIKHAGVGLARKIGMDEALYRFASIDRDGLIVCLDADCTVAENYLQTIEHAFDSDEFDFATIYFEHQDYILNDTGIQKAIIDYELFLRYYVEGLEFSGYPFSFFTVGSSMAVKASVYALHGGMNKKKAGEDFYFLHKLAPVRKHQFIGTTAVYPGIRTDIRVPFGTAKALNEAQKTNFPEFQTYDPQCFEILKQSLEIINNHQNKEFDSISEILPEPVKSYVIQNNDKDSWNRIVKNTKKNGLFLNDFYQWFDGFRTLKFIHFLTDNYFPKIPLNQAVGSLLNKPGKTNIEFLYHLRNKYRIKQ